MRWFLLVLGMALSGCATTGGGVAASAHREPELDGVYHRVREGETLYRLARAYALPEADLASANRILNPKALRAGDTLFIPGAGRALSAKEVSAPGARASATQAMPARAVGGETRPRSAPSTELDALARRLGERSSSNSDSEGESDDPEGRSGSGGPLRGDPVLPSGAAPSGTSAGSYTGARALAVGSGRGTVAALPSGASAGFAHGGAAARMNEESNRGSKDVARGRPGDGGRGAQSAGDGRRDDARRDDARRDDARRDDARRGDDRQGDEGSGAHRGAGRVERGGRHPGASLGWPVRGVLYARFGKKGREPHDGIDLAAPRGTPVQAAGAGRVVHAGEQKAYGNIVIIDHGRGLLTLYAHNHELRVRSGQRVREGQVIATVGESGRTSGPHLHFEVRRDGKPVDPLGLLGGPSSQGKASARRRAKH